MYWHHSNICIRVSITISESYLDLVTCAHMHNITLLEHGERTLTTVSFSMGSTLCMVQIKGSHIFQVWVPVEKLLNVHLSNTIYTIRTLYRIFCQQGEIISSGSMLKQRGLGACSPKKNLKFTTSESASGGLMVGNFQGGGIPWFPTL